MGEMIVGAALVLFGIGVGILVMLLIAASRLKEDDDY